jgi:hypothetical protein
MGMENALAAGTANYFIGREQNRATQRASDAASASAAAQLAEQQRQFDTAREDLAPWREAGQTALGRLDRTSAGDMSAFTASPDYNFRRSEGQRDIGSSFAARGGAASGNALRALSEFNQNLASGEFGQWWNRQAGIAGVGQSAVNSGNALGANYAAATGDIRNNLQNQQAQYNWQLANSRASGIANTNAAFQQSNANTANIAGYFFGRK